MNSPTETRNWVVTPDPREGFTIGWDFACYGLPLPKNAEEDLREGFRAGLQRFGSYPKPHDRFIRKWLQIRIGAWRRNRVFDPAVTPEYIEQITPEYCPVTRERLTVGTRTGTDASIDRILNDGGYAPGNLVVMSTRVNLAKDALSYADILRIVARNKAVKGLSALEWARLASIIGMVADRESLLPLLAVSPAKMVVTNKYTILQIASMYAASFAHYQSLKVSLRQCCPGKKAKRAMDEYFRIAWAVLRRHGASGGMSQNEAFWVFGDAWIDGTLMKAFKSWISELDDDALLGCHRAVTKGFTEVRAVKCEVREAWCESTRGYAV